MADMQFNSDELETGGSATIKHRCVTHLCGSNAIEQVLSNEF